MSHDGELTHVLPALRTRVRPRHVSLTDASNRDEAVRNYAADRVNRIPHGVIDLLSAWHARRGGGRWALACDDFDRRSAITGKFFHHLLRRRGGVLGLSMVVAVEPGAGPSVARELAVAAHVRVVRAALPGSAAAAPDPDPDQAGRKAAEMEAWVRRDTLYVRLHAHTLARLWEHANRPERAIWWRMAELGMLTQLGYYEDALSL
ncbi:MAG: hypothetical protein JO306_16605, partial [Gemmatimonadetes bacterium]|nr:hypothetical protein [Gemmatimonadota bacterium]